VTRFRNLDRIDCLIILVGAGLALCQTGAFSFLSSVRTAVSCIVLMELGNLLAATSARPIQPE
jgi:hypothetical protein